jgi:hypothetical protein
VFEKEILPTQNWGVQVLMRDTHFAYQRFGGEQQEGIGTVGVE